MSRKDTNNQHPTFLLPLPLSTVVPHEGEGCGGRGVEQHQLPPAVGHPSTACQREPRGVARRAVCVEHVQCERPVARVHRPRHAEVHRLAEQRTV